MSFDEIKKNKTAQLIAGLLTAAIAYKLWQMGVWERWLDPPDTEGYQDTGLLAMGVAALVSALQLFGLLSLTFIGQIFLFAKANLKPLATKASAALNQATTQQATDTKPVNLTLTKEVDGVEYYFDPQAVSDEIERLSKQVGELDQHLIDWSSKLDGATARNLFNAKFVDEVNTRMTQLETNLDNWTNLLTDLRDRVERLGT